jgi:hypothetical protein
MVFRRDPLSVTYDARASFVLDTVIAQHERHVANPLRVVDHLRVTVPNPAANAGQPREAGGARLSVDERAFSRALYHDDRVHKATSDKKPRNGNGGGARSGDWSLKLEWEDVPAGRGRPRYVRVRVFPARAGIRHSERKPKSERYSATPALRSTAALDQLAER